MNTIEQLAKQIRFLKIMVGILLIVLVVFGIKLFAGDKTSAAELTVQRLNIVEADGTLRMVISNKEKQHPGAIDGKDLPKRERDAGMVFFNDKGDECGGLMYSGDKTAPVWFIPSTSIRTTRSCSCNITRLTKAKK